ncbi:MAG: hypothetical protein RL616_1196 [Verrucomicrobiota bacterium]|jgi:hypothetical protein
MKAAPPKLSRAQPKLVAGILGLIALVIAAVVFFFNPATHGIYPICQFHKLTGLDCPGCGMTRALYALLHGKFSAALRDNALFIGGIFFLAARAGWWSLNRRRGRMDVEFFPLKFLWPLLLLALVFTVLRNLPPFACLSPE